MNSTVEENFLQAEKLNRNVLSIIYQMSQNHDTAKRQTLVSDSLKLIKSFSDLVTINEFKINQSIEPSIEHLYLLDKYKLILYDLKFHLRSAQLESKKQEDIYDKQEKTEYLKNVFVAEDEEGEQRANLVRYNGNKEETKKTEEQILRETKAKSTSTFLRTRQLLQTAVFQSEMAVDNFKESSENLRYMNSSFDTMNDLLDRAKSIVHSLNQMGSKQRTQVKYALYFFIGCCAFVIFKRTFGMVGKIYWLVSLPIRLILLPFRILFSLLKMFMGSDNAGIEQAENILGITEDLLTDTVTSLNAKWATTTTSLLSQVTSSVEGYEELSNKLSSIINNEDSTILATATGRIVDEL